MAVGGREGEREEKRGHGRKRKEEGGRRVLKAGNGASKKKRGEEELNSLLPPLSPPPFLSPISYHVRTSRETQLSSLLLFYRAVHQVQAVAEGLHLEERGRAVRALRDRHRRGGAERACHHQPGENHLTKREITKRLLMFFPISDLPRRALHLPRVGRPLGGAQVGRLLPRLLPRGGQVAVRGGAGGRERVQASANQRRFPKFFLYVRNR